MLTNDILEIYKEAKAHQRDVTVRLLYFDRASLSKDPLLLLLERSSHGRLPGQLEPPGGQLNREELPLKALVRETYEETGVMIKEEDLQFLAYLDFTTAQGKLIREFFFLTVAPAKQIHLCEQEHTSYVWIPFKKISEYPLHPNIKKFLSQQTPCIQKLFLNFP